MTLWAIQYMPMSGRSKPWIDYRTIRRLKHEAWAVPFAEAAPAWWDELTRRKRAGLIRCVKVTIQLKETP